MASTGTNAWVTYTSRVVPPKMHRHRGTSGQRHPSDAGPSPHKVTGRRRTPLPSPGFLSG
jgi:hypothetical protein